MEADEVYYARKVREIAYLQKLARRPGKAAAASSVHEVVRTKAKLRAALLAREALTHPSLTETERRKESEHHLGPFTLQYGYARYDLSVKGPPVYPGLEADDPGHIRETIYTVSGMAAISMVVLALNHLYRRARVIAYRGSYFETQHLLTDFADNLTPCFAADPRDLKRLLSDKPGQGGPTILLIDSYVGGNWQRLDRIAPDAAVDLLLFDTTCYSARSSRLRRLLAWAEERGIPAVCLRSHLKLDSLGMEYGRLGSAVFTASAANAAPQRLALFRDIIEVSRDCMRSLGVGVLPSLLPPFQGDPDFLALNDVRIARIVRNNLYAARRLAEALGPDMRVRRYHHNLFFTLDLGEGKTADGGPSPAMAEAAASLAEHLRAARIPAAHSGSFGFDFIAIDEFVDVARTVPVIRCAVSDLPASLIDGFIAATTAWSRDWSYAATGSDSQSS